MYIFFLYLFIITEHVSPQKVCCYQDVLDHLNMSRMNEVYSSTRPVRDHTHPTVLHLDVYVCAILNVNEKAQTFSPLIWIQMSWNDERITWDPAQFCGITQVSLPKEFLWKPDIFIYEMTQSDVALPNPYLYMTNEGKVFMEEDLKVVSTCRMDVHKFPFDTQSCNITITSVIHSINELRLVPSSNSSRVTQFSHRLMQTQGEWEFLSLSVTNNTFVLNKGCWDQIIYTISMKRRPLLHVINFLLPVLFFLCLDLSSFLISDHRGDKLGYKVTVLLAISVLLLILNEILPSMSNRTPLIATYCIVIFALMLLSLLETVLVTYLMEKDSRILVENAEQKWSRASDSYRNTCKEGNCTHGSAVCNGSRGETPHELLPVAEEGVNNPQRADSHLLLLILEELREMRSLSGSRSTQGPGGKTGYWTRMARRTNTAFFSFYLTAVSLFLLFLFLEWNS